MSKNTKEQEIPYSYLVDNIKIFLIFLVVLITLLHSSWLKQIRLFVLCGMELPYFICRRSFLYPVICPRSLRM